MKFGRFLCVVAILSTWIPSAFSAWFGYSGPQEPPLSTPFSVSKAGYVFTTEIKIVDYRSYHFILRLGFNENDFEDKNRVAELAGKYGRDKFGKLIHPGIEIPLNIKISAIDQSGERVIFDKTISDAENDGMSVNNYSLLIHSIALRPGQYRIRIENLKEIPELANTPISFVIGWRPNTTPIKD